MSFITLSDDMATRATNCSVFERALDALPDGVLLVNSDRRIVYTNPAFKRLWKVPDEILDSRNDERVLKYVLDQLADPKGFFCEVERLHPTVEASEDEIAFKDGRTVSRRSLPFQENGAFSARIWIFTDVTEAKNATTDHLTRLPNRLAFSREFPPFVTAAPDGLLRSVAIVDVDHFKQYNDLYGHALGDEVLSEIGALLRSYVRQTGDVAFRIGGEEFLMAVRTRKSEEGFAFFDAVRKSVLAMNRLHAGNVPIGIVTISAGYGTFQSASEPGEVFKRIDKALYRAKATGRNRIVNAEI